MKQYIDHLKHIQEFGTEKPAAREGMPSSRSFFGYQNRYDLSLGFPILTTKDMFWKGIVGELLWFLKGDANIKFLVDNGIDIWNQDAYKYYCEIAKSNVGEEINAIMMPCSLKNNERAPLKSSDVDSYSMFTFDEFCLIIKSNRKENLGKYKGYTLGDCGHQYGKVWRDWKVLEKMTYFSTDQVSNLIKGLIETPESRRHIVTAVDPAHDQDLALYWCHSMFQCNVRPMTIEDRWDLFQKFEWNENIMKTQKSSDDSELERICNEHNVPKYYMDLQMYQRSADMILGVPFNISSYSLLLEILCAMTGMIPGSFIHTFGDSHIYSNHKEALQEQLSRTPTELPKLVFSQEFNDMCHALKEKHIDIDWFLNHLKIDMFKLEGYKPQGKISAKLSTGLQ